MCGAGPRVRQMATQNKWWLKERLSNEQEKVIKYIAIVETVGTVPFCVITNLKSRSFHIIILFPYWWLSCNKLFSLSVNKHWGLAGREKKWFVVSGIGDHYWSSYWFSNKQHYLSQEGHYTQKIQYSTTFRIGRGSVDKESLLLHFHAAPEKILDFSFQIQFCVGPADFIQT